ncbi:MAG: hypothetical protein ACFFG0_02980 [Candidatus Thorarchaeota archaeon]
MKNKTKRKQNKRHLENLLDKIVFIKPQKHYNSDFFSYCSFGAHQGIIGARKSEICRQRQCNHYIEFRSNDIPQTYKLQAKK